jgi:polysaccharide chain length determinant protein (PEP-CTERM system associated)
MHELIVQLLRYARGTWRYRWWMLGVAWAICLVGWTIVARLPDQFQASARVFVDTSSVLSPFLRGLAMDTSDVDRKLSLMTRTLLSRPNLEKVMRMTDLDLQARTAQDKEELIADLRKKLRFGGTRRENLYTIRYQAESPELATLVVKSLLTIFMEGNLGEVSNDQDTARQFIERQIEEYERDIEDIQKRLIRFKQENMGLLPDEQEGYYNRLLNLQADQEKTQLELSILEDRLASVQRQLTGEEPTFGLGSNTNISRSPAITVDTSAYDRRIQAAQLRIDELLIKYTERHPDVVSSRLALESLEEERTQFVAEAKKAYSSGTVSESIGRNIKENPVYQQMRIDMGKLESDISAKRRLLSEYSSKVEELEGSLDKVLELQAEKSELERTLENSRKNRLVLVTRMESAALGEKATTSGETVRFRIIDPPRAPTKPSGPNRVFLSSGVLLIALGAGLALAFLMSQLRPTYDERQMMTESLGIPVLGSVNMVWTSDQIRARKMRNVSFVFTLTALLVTFGTVLALYQFDIDLLPRLAQSLQLT